jgi:hypothetical protein
MGKTKEVIGSNEVRKLAKKKINNLFYVRNLLK